MHRRAIVSCVTVLAALLQLTTEAGAQPKPDGDPGPKKGSEVYVIMKARLYEVDDAFYKRLAKAKPLTQSDLEKLERQPQGPTPAAESLSALLEKQKMLVAGKVINIDPGKEGVLVAATKAIDYLPTPDQLQQGRRGPQTFHEGVTLRAQVQLSPDRRFVRAKFMEQSLEIEATDKVNVPVDLKGTEAVGEIVFPREANLSQVRVIPDGGSFLLPLQYRPRAAKEKDRWLVVEVEPRIYIEEEEISVAKLNIRTIDTALQGHKLKNGQFPEKLKVLTEGDKPILKAEDLKDPWGKPYNYDPDGPKNMGKKPDVWAEAPGKKIIGNWEEKKPEGKGDREPN